MTADADLGTGTLRVLERGSDRRHGRRRPGGMHGRRRLQPRASQVRSTCRRPTRNVPTASSSIDGPRSTVRFEAVLERLATLPDVLPPPAAALMPVFLGDADGGPSRIPPTGRAGRPAGVLVLIHPGDDGEARVVLTERVTRDGHHSGEVSFPGGKAEPHDADLVATALREATEEVALDAAAAGVRVVGLLERFWIPVSDFEVTPVVAVATRRPSWSRRPTRSPASSSRRSPGSCRVRRSPSSSGRSARGRSATAPTTSTGCRSGVRPPGS